MVKKRMPFFWIGILGGLLLLMVSNYVRSSFALMPASIACFGITIFFCPFTTPQTVEMLGLKKSFRVGRVAGVMFLIGAAALFVVLQVIRKPH